MRTGSVERMSTSKITPELLVSAFFQLGHEFEESKEFMVATQAGASHILRGLGEDENDPGLHRTESEAQDSFDRDIQSVVTTLKGVGDKYEKGMSEATSETRRRIISEAFDLSGGVEYETFHASALIVKRVVEKTTGADVDAAQQVIGSILVYCRTLVEEAATMLGPRQSEFFSAGVQQHATVLLRSLWGDGNFLLPEE